MYETYCKLRDQKGYKDADIVKATGITKSTFSDWKSGRSAPKNDKLQKIADFFGVTVDYLTTGKESDDKTIEDDTLMSYEKLLKIYTRGKNNLTSEEKIRLAQIILADRNDK
ncbi:MAG TPA: helix-turn-helix transcriptional regulator [Clostridiales bacterium]|nr:helix-turn-helix transcriptional regulator [Clostridiales bacterium]